MIMLQQLDPQTKENLGGLFINPEFISEIIPQSEFGGPDPILRCQIIMNNGNFYLVLFCVSEVYDEILAYNRLIGKFPTPKTYTGPR
jgi:uncharacterized protein YlzI (FlbEa/FlbD family)